jgi:hypothetical protein
VALYVNLEIDFVAFRFIAGLPAAVIYHQKLTFTAILAVCLAAPTLFLMRA